MMESDHTNEKNRVIMRIVTEETVDELRAVGGFFSCLEVLCARVKTFLRRIRSQQYFF